MKTRTLILLLALAMPAIACSASGKSGTQPSHASATVPGGQLNFLQQMGIDASGIYVIEDEFDSDGLLNKDGYDAIMLEPRQIISLLPYVRPTDPDEGVGGNYGIEAIKPLDGGLTLLVGFIEYGDGGTQMLCTYDRQGNLKDKLDLGNWGEFYTERCNDEMTEGTARVTNSKLRFDGNSNFTVVRTTRLVDWLREPDNEALPSNFTKQYWKLTKTYSYRIGSNGRFTLIDTKTERQGEPADFEIYNDIEEVGRLPMSDSRRIDRFNDMCNEMARKLDNHEMDMDVSYNLQAVLVQIYCETPQQLLMWIYHHRNTNTPVVNLFEQVFAQSWLDKYRLVTDIEAITDKAARNYLSQLTAQWGPSDAVG